MPPAPLVPSPSERLLALGLEPDDLRLLACLDGVRDLPAAAALAGVPLGEAPGRLGRLVAAALVDLTLPVAPPVAPPLVPPVVAPAAAPALPAPDLPAPDLPAPRLSLVLPDEAPAAHPAATEDADTAALLRELTLLGVTTPGRTQPRRPVPEPEAAVPSAAPAGTPDRRRFGLFGR